jgi:hypothetical protein
MATLEMMEGGLALLFGWTAYLLPSVVAVLTVPTAYRAGAALLGGVLVGVDLLRSSAVTSELVASGGPPMLVTSLPDGGSLALGHHGTSEGGLAVIGWRYGPSTKTFTLRYCVDQTTGEFRIGFRRAEAEDEELPPPPPQLLDSVWDLATATAAAATQRI